MLFLFIFHIYNFVSFLLLFSLFPFVSISIAFVAVVVMCVRLSSLIHLKICISINCLVALCPQKYVNEMNATGILVFPNVFPYLVATVFLLFGKFVIVNQFSIQKSFRFMEMRSTYLVQEMSYGSIWRRTRVWTIFFLLLFLFSQWIPSLHIWINVNGTDLCKQLDLLTVGDTLSLAVRPHFECHHRTLKENQEMKRNENNLGRKKRNRNTCAMNSSSTIEQTHCNFYFIEFCIVKLLN